VPAAELAPIRPGQRVTFSVSSFPGETFEGRVIEIGPAVEAESRSAKVRIQVTQRSAKLKAGMFAEGEIRTGMERPAIVIPTAAVYREEGAAGESYVFVVEDGKAARRTVRVGHQRDASVEISRGLKPGEMLVAEQSVELAPGVRVEPARR